MPKCTRKGCGKEFSDSENGKESCSYHSGGPVFHEGLKSWSCCKDVNKPVLDFESFMQLPGCTVDKHTSEKPKESGLQTLAVAAGSASVPPAVVSQQTVSLAADGTETYSSGATAPILAPAASTAPVPRPLIVEDEDDVDAPASGKKCLRFGCGKSFVSQEASRTGEGDDATCVYHPAGPIFHEGSKGYMCCKRRVLEFDDFLKIEGCKTGKHVFVKKRLPGESVDDLVQCRLDHYQTPTQVFVSVFAKKADKERSVLVFEEEQIHLDLFLPDSKRFTKSLVLYGPINPATSKFTFFGTKVELVISKAAARSWNMLERPSDGVLPEGYNLTFGVSGRTGSTGAKAPVLDNENQLKSS